MINYWNSQSLTSIGPINAFTEYLFSNMHEVRSKHSFYFKWVYDFFQVFIIWTSDVTSQEMWKRKLTSIQETINNGNNFSLKCHIVSVVQRNTLQFQHGLYLYIFSSHPYQAFLSFYILCSIGFKKCHGLSIFYFWHNFVRNQWLLKISVNSLTIYIPIAAFVINVWRFYQKIYID